MYKKKEENKIINNLNRAVAVRPVVTFSYGKDLTPFIYIVISI